MTAMLQPSGVFDNSIFTGALYSRGTGSKSHSPIDHQFSAANPYGGSSVWSAPTRDELDIAPIKPPVKQQSNDRRPEKLSLVPPRSRPRSQWRPTGEFVDHTNLQRDEPLSAHSKSHRADSATLTPSSRSMSDSDYSTAQSESNTIHHQVPFSHYNRLDDAHFPCKWDQIGEFQPRSQIPRAAFSNTLLSQPQKGQLTSTKLQTFDPAPFGQTPSQQYNAFANTQNKINPISTLPGDNSNDTKSSHHQIGSLRGFHVSATAKTSALSTLHHETGRQYGFQPNLNHGYTNFDCSKLHDVHSAPKSHTDPYTRKSLPPNQDTHFMAPNSLKRDPDISAVAPSVTLNGRNYLDNTHFQNGGYHDLPQTRSTNYGLQSLNFRPFYHNESHAAHLAQAFSFDYHPVSSESQGNHRTNGARMDSAAPHPYVSTDQCFENPHESTHIVRSQLLEDFRMNHKTRKFEFRDIYDHIVEFSGDQLGSRFIQHKLENANSDEKDQVFSEIAPDARQLMTDVFGNYVIQKLFEHGSQSQKKALANQMRGHMLTLSMQTYGCRVVQKAFEHILTSQQAELVQELDGHILKVVENQNGNHVIQKAIECIPGKYVKFIVQAHRGHVHYLSKHAYGCRVIQRMLEHCDLEAKRVILDELHHDISDLIQDPFGNYVVQHVIVKGELCDRISVIDKVQVKLVENAMHKFASNVVEKALDHANAEQRDCMLRTLTGRDEDDQSLPTKLLNHQFGNYVIQKAVMHLEGSALNSLVEEMRRYLTQLRRVSTGKQVAALEDNIRNAQNRLDLQRANTYMLSAPTQPIRYNTGRR